MEAKYIDKFKALEEAVGNTPMARIKLRYKGKERFVYAKLEYYNFSGSIKDRIAFEIMKHGYLTGAIKPGYEIAEASSGNTGIAFSAMGAYMGHKAKIFIPDWMSSERLSLIRSFGADIILVTKEQGGFTGSVQKAKDYALEQGNVFLPLQFENDANVAAHYKTTGPEIFRQMNGYHAELGAFTAGVATGGTIMGTGLFLKQAIPSLRIFPMEPASCSTLLNGQVGPHRIQGIGDEFIPKILELDKLDEIVEIHDGDAIIMAQKLSRELGLGVGISSGANFLSAVYTGSKFGIANVVTTFADDNKKYLTTDYAKVEQVKPNYISSDVELMDFDLIR